MQIATFYVVLQRSSLIDVNIAVQWFGSLDFTIDSKTNCELNCEQVNLDMILLLTPGPRTHPVGSMNVYF